MSDIDKWVLYHKPTKTFMPEIKRGYTYWEPNEDHSRHHPRLFPSPRSAILSARHWVKGNAHVAFSPTGCFGDLEPAGVEYTRVEGRCVDDLQVIKATLSIRKPKDE